MEKHADKDQAKSEAKPPRLADVSGMPIYRYPPFQPQEPYGSSKSVDFPCALSLPELRSAILLLCLSLALANEDTAPDGEMIRFTA